MNESVVLRGSWQGSQYYMKEVLKKTGQLFYIHNIRETSYENVEEVLDFYRNLWPSFLVFLALENIILYCQKKRTIRLNDGITSLSHGIIQECGRMIFRGSESAAYVFIYNNWRLVDLPWDSPSTWYSALLMVDFCYYWVHRASHEIHIFWAQHQVHHSSEEFNVAVGVRQSLLQGWCSFIFYLPLALFVPPAHFVAHQQFSLIYQVFYNQYVIDKMKSLDGMKNKVLSIVKGPSWELGSPWTGFESKKINITSREVFDVKISFLTNLYVSIHFIIIFMEFQHLAHIYLSKGSIVVLIYIAYIILSLTAIGIILENHPKAGLVEILRCFLYFFYIRWLSEKTSSFFMQLFFSASILIWFFQYLSRLLLKKKIN